MTVWMSDSWGTREQAIPGEFAALVVIMVTGAAFGFFVLWFTMLRRERTVLHRARQRTTLHARLIGDTETAGLFAGTAGVDGVDELDELDELDETAELSESEGGGLAAVSAAEPVERGSEAAELEAAELEPAELGPAELEPAEREAVDPASA